MKMLVGTDFHGFRSAFNFLAGEASRQSADAIIVCGDITNFGTLEEAKSLLSTLASVGVPVFFVPGNCDPPSIASLNFNNLKCIHGVGLLFRDLLLLGVGGSPITPFNTFFEMSEEEISRVLQACLSNIDDKIGGSHKMLVVSHSPPKNTRLDRTALGLHVGSESLRKFIEEHKPTVVVCGHIHEAKGEDILGETLIVNPGAARHGNYAILHVEKNIIKANFHTMRS
ncbi:MAG: metallophosphoesterase [Candidatus Bathyarchaeota archaeon]|nr:metallophosphoesterase [Candidatus Bathyarchaeota archaeon]